ncbi:uncharacterized protein TNCV_2705481 [Trichonephila clavipes]|nr:uncharacterized protein TNCV_2705481 [Trichonephila clavipes]
MRALFSPSDSHLVGWFLLTQQSVILAQATLDNYMQPSDERYTRLLATDHVILNHGQVTWTTPELAPPLLTTTPHQREDVSALDRFKVHRCPTRRVFSGTGLEPMTKQATFRYQYHSATAATRWATKTRDPSVKNYAANGFHLHVWNRDCFWSSGDVIDYRKSLGNIAKVVGRSVNCIQKILQRFKKTGILANNEGRGRKKIMNSITERRVIHQVKIDPKISAPKIAASALGRSVSAETVRRVLRKAGYNGRVARKKPLIGKRNRVKRLKFAKEHILKPRQFWNEVIFSDERVSSTSSAVTDVVWCGSSDLNVIENLWFHFERAVQKHQITSKEQLKSVLQEELLNIAPERPLDILWNQCLGNWKLSYLSKRRRFVEWAQNEIAVVPDFHKRILFSDEAHFWLNGYVNKQNCRIWSEANPQVYVETPLHPGKLTVWCALWAGGILLQKR